MADHGPGCSLSDGDIKIYYWPATGRAEPIRLMLAEAGVAWEDVCFDKSPHIGVYSSSTSLGTLAQSPNFEAFTAKCRELGKNSTTNIPMVELGGKFYTQSTALYRFIARKAGLYPEQIEEAFVVDNVMAHVEDARGFCYGFLFNPDQHKLLNIDIPKHLGNFERLLGDGDFFLPGFFSVADVQVFDLLHNMIVAMVPDVLKAYPKLSALYDRIASRSQIRAYLASEKCRAMDKFVPITEFAQASG